LTSIKNEVENELYNLWFNMHVHIDIFMKAWRNWKEGTISNLISPMLLKGGPKAEMMRCIHVSLLCVQQNVGDRPDMTSVILMLNNDFVALPVPTQPASFMHSNVKSDTPLELDINCGGSIYEASVSELDPR
jgi:hypothetical protein